MNQQTSRTTGPNLLDTIKAIRVELGDCLNDTELTYLIRETVLPSEVGFTFLCFAEGFALFRVPPQDLAQWYTATGWIKPEKENIVRQVATKNELSVYEPADEKSCFSSAGFTRHHLQLVNRFETVIVAHPRYLKIRVFSCQAPSHSRVSNQPLCLKADLLEDLSALYPR